MRIELKAPVEAQRLVPIELKPALYADQCDACGLIFEMKEWCGELRRAELLGVFDRSVEDEEGRGLGNMFSATVCSFLCAHKLFAEDGWKTLSRFAVYARAGARLVRAEVVLTANRATEEQLVRAWEEAPETNRVRASTIGFVSR